jgi:hypothetical protein
MGAAVSPAGFLPFAAVRCSTGLVLRILKLFGFLAGLAAFAWFGLTVKLGERTLFQHFSAIGSSEPSQELLRGAKDKVGELGHMLRGQGGAGAADSKPAAEPERAAAEAPAKPSAHPEAKAVGKPSERLTQSDRHQMRRLIESSRHQARN